MKIKPVALPRPKTAQLSALSIVESAIDSKSQLAEMTQRREALSYQLELLDAEIEGVGIESICGGVDDTQDVETYDGKLGVTRDFVDTHEPAIGQLQWLDDLSNRFNGPNDSPGNVADIRWGSGGLFGDDLYITAGHCFDQFGGGWQRPRRNGFVIEPDEIATLMKINFNFQVDGVTGDVRPGQSFPVVELLEYRLGGLDYAIVRVGKNDQGKLPHEAFGAMTMAVQDLMTPGSVLCMIQHPSGRPKQIEAGPMFANIGGQITYDSLDTEGGSSGSLIISPDGEVVGVHTNGGCTAFSGANRGVAIGAIRTASNLTL